MLPRVLLWEIAKRHKHIHAVLPLRRLLACSSDDRWILAYETWKCSTWASAVCMWHLHFSCISVICVWIFFKPIVEITFNDRSQDAEKCILSIQLYNLFQTKGCWYFCKSGHWFRCRNKVSLKKKRKSLIFIYITFSIMAITATKALCALHNDWVQKQGSDLLLHMGSAKGTWLQVPEHEHWLLPGLISTQATIINRLMFYISIQNKLLH